MPLSWSISGLSTCVYSGPSAISPSPHALHPPARHPHPPRQQVIHQALFKSPKLINLSRMRVQLALQPSVDGRSHDQFLCSPKRNHYRLIACWLMFFMLPLVPVASISICLRISSSPRTI